MAVQALPLLQEEARKRQLEHLKIGPKSNESPSTPRGADGRYGSVAIAAKMVGLGENTVRRAADVQKEKNPPPDLPRRGLVKQKDTREEKLFGVGTNQASASGLPASRTSRSARSMASNIAARGTRSSCNRASTMR